MSPVDPQVFVFFVSFPHFFEVHSYENAFPAAPAAPAARQRPNPAQTLTSKMTSLTLCSR